MNGRIQKSMLSPNKVLLKNVADLNLEEQDLINQAFIWQSSTYRYHFKRQRNDILVTRTNV